MPHGDPPAMGEQLIGRRDEIALLDDLLSKARPERFAYLCGPGGVGKTALLTEWARRCRVSGRTVGWIDGRAIGPNESDVLAALGDAFGATVASADDLAPALAETGEPVLILDTFEQLASLERWFRERLFPSLPRSALVLFAGRSELAPAWVLDLGWRELLVVHRLENLDRSDAIDYLVRRESPTAQAERVVDAIGTYPLGLALAADGIEGGAKLDAIPHSLASPDDIAALVALLVSEAPSELHRTAVAASALVARLTEDLLRAMLATDDVADVFDWLRGLSAYETCDRGLLAHDLVRQLVGMGLATKDPALYRSLVTRARDYYAEAHRTGILDEKDTLEGLLRLSGHWTYFGMSLPTPPSFVSSLRPTCTRATELPEETWAAVEAIARRHEGETAVERLRRHRPHSTIVLDESGGEVRGFSQCLQLGFVPEPSDPALQILFDAVRRRGVDPSGLKAARYWMAADDHQRPGPTVSRLLLTFNEHLLFGEDPPAMAVLSADPDWIAEGFAGTLLDLGGDLAFEMDGRRWGWHLAVLRDRTAAQWAIDHHLSTLGVDEESTGGFETFRRQVAGALRALDDEPALGRLELARTLADSGALPATDDDRARGRALAELLLDACGLFDTSPKDAQLRLVVHATFRDRPARNQEEIARLLGLSFGSYRRYVSQAVRRIADALWRRAVPPRD